MITRAFIESDARGRMEPEMRAVADELEVRGVPVEPFIEKRLLRRQLPLSAQTLVVGYIPTILSALKQMNLEPTILDDYPECLRHFLYRRIWESTVGSVIRDLHEGTRGAVFVKPKGRMKRFTGTVFTSPSDIMYMENASARTPVYCAEVVRWLSEFRVFVIHGEIVGIRPYSDDASVAVDESIVRKAIQVYQESGEAPAGYGIDFGILDSGETALIEINDGFGLGAYGLEQQKYTDLILARWQELVSPQ